jgi:Arc/MetJ-type ribon-helix-helix transcriptional regulator
MATKKRQPAKSAQQPEPDEYKQKVSVWVAEDQLEQISEIRRRAGFGSTSEIMREALKLGLEQILARYPR